jgi:ribose-phosphate pyrophosphokinase
MIRTGSSLMGAAAAYKDAGATEVSALTTHGVFPGQALETLRQSGLFAAIACTDSHPRADELADDFLEVHSISELLSASLLDRGIRGKHD